MAVSMSCWKRRSHSATQLSVHPSCPPSPPCPSHPSCPFISPSSILPAFPLPFTFPRVRNETRSSYISISIRSSVSPWLPCFSPDAASRFSVSNLHRCCTPEPISPNSPLSDPGLEHFFHLPSPLGTRFVCQPPARRSCRMQIDSGTGYRVGDAGP